MKTTEYTHTITNSCTCVDCDPETGMEQASDGCYGWCWEDVLSDFEYDTKELRESNETGWWKVSDLRLWSGEVSGYFHATTVKDILRGMTVNSEWTMRYTAYPDRVEYSLSHHDAMGSASTLTAVSEEEREELGLY
jgi:hypothetical protein